MAKEFLRRIFKGGSHPEESHLQITADIWTSAMQSAMSGEVVRINAAEEARKEQYLDTLSPIDRQKVSDFVSFSSEYLQAILGDTRIAVTAVGSTTRPESQRHHTPGDIDLRILNSQPADSPERESTIKQIREEVRQFLHSKGAIFDEEDATTEVHMVRESRGGLVPFADFYNNDPSFTVHAQEGLPLHISISGIDNYPKEEYLEREARQNTTTVVLLD